MVIQVESGKVKIFFGGVEIFREWDCFPFTFSNKEISRVVTRLKAVLSKVSSPDETLEWSEKRPEYLHVWKGRQEKIIVLPSSTYKRLKALSKRLKKVL
jgi:hypothetical protein